MDLNSISNYILNYFKSIPVGLLHSLGYVLVFFSAIFEAIPIFGTLIPGQSLIILSGFLASQGLINIYFLLVIASIGSIIGDIIAFEMGKHWGEKFLKKYGEYVLINEKRNKKLKKLIKKNLGKSIFIGRYNSVTRAFVPFLCGSLKIKYLNFLYWNILTGILWGSTWVLVGYFAGKSFEIVARYIGLGILVATIISIVFWVLFKYLKEKKHIFTKYQLPILITNIISIYVFSKMIEDILDLEFITILDNWISSHIMQLWNPILNSIFKFVTHFADTISIIIISVIIFIYLHYKKNKFDSYFYLTNIILGLLLVELIKNLIGRIRPQEQLISMTNYAFPSGHSTFSAIVALSIYFIYKDIYKKNLKHKYLLLLFLYPLIIGFSRIYLNVHWFSDVIGGLSLGVFIVTFNYLIFEYLKKIKKYN